MTNFYASSKTSGVDTKQFYRSLGSSMYEVSEKTGISRAALSRVPVKMASNQVADITLEFLENEIRERYLEDFETLKKEIEDAWIRYLTRDKILEKCRREYGLERKNSLIEKMDLGQVKIDENS